MFSGFSHQDQQWIANEFPTMNRPVFQPHRIANHFNSPNRQPHIRWMELWISEEIQRVHKSSQLLEEIKGQLIDYELKTKTRVFDEDNDVDICTICQIEYCGRENLGVLKCGHDYHSECIKKWLMLKNSCPLCKQTALSSA